MHRLGRTIPDTFEAIKFQLECDARSPTEEREKMKAYFARETDQSDGMQQQSPPLNYIRGEYFIKLLRQSLINLKVNECFLPAGAIHVSDNRFLSRFSSMLNSSHAHTYYTIFYD